MKQRFVHFFVALSLMGCGSRQVTDADLSGGDVGGGGTAGLHVDGESARLQGSITYDRVPAITNASNPQRALLDFAQTSSAPVRFARIALLDAKNTTIAETTTDGQGAYTFPLPPTNQVKVRVFSQTAGAGVPKVRVQDNTNSGALYAVDSPLTDLFSGPTLNLHLASGYNNQGEVTNSQRPAGAFAVMDAIVVAAQALGNGGEELELLPETVVNWSVNNSTADGDPRLGAIDTSHYEEEPNQLFILGKAGNDTDEYDWHVMIHEYGHWYQANTSVAHDPGGNHGTGVGQIKDARLAFGEAFGNALGAIILEDPIYRDTKGPANATGFTTDMETNNAEDGDTRGWFAEATMGYLIYDLFDPVNPQEPSGLNDRTALPLSSLRAALQFQKTAGALSTIFSFLEGLKDDVEPQILADLLAFHTKDANFGINSTERFATGETHDAGDPNNLPLYRDAVLGSQAFTLKGVESNEMGANHFYRWTGTGSPVTFLVDAKTNKLSVSVFEDGKGILGLEFEGADDHTFPSKAGAVYILVLRKEAAGDLTSTLTFSSL